MKSMDPIVMGMLIDYEKAMEKPALIIIFAIESSDANIDHWQSNQLQWIYRKME